MLLEPYVSVTYCDKISSNTQFEEGRKGYFGFLAWRDTSHHGREGMEVGDQYLWQEAESEQEVRQGHTTSVPIPSVLLPPEQL